MVVQKVDKETKKALLDAHAMMEAIAKTDANEAETRRRVERFFETLMGYDVFKHITREHAIHSVGDAEHCDFAVQIEDKPVMLVELKRVGVDIMPKHLKQAASYAINLGCEWVLLTNGREWGLYHISFGQPPQIVLVESWQLMNDDLAVLAQKFDLVGYRNVKRGGLDRLWEKNNVLTPRNVLKVILSEDSLAMMRRELRKMAGITLTPEEIVGAIRRLLNESAGAEMDTIKIALPEKHPVKVKHKSAVTAAKAEPEKTEAETS
jgi:predicted type IV restriction endonuclease